MQQTSFGNENSYRVHKHNKNYSVKKIRYIIPYFYDVNINNSQRWV